MLDPCISFRSVADLLGAMVVFFCATGFCDETAARGLEGFSWSNVLFFSELERTNPALLRSMSETWAPQEHQIVADGYRKIPYLREFTDLFPTNIEFRLFSLKKPQLWVIQTGLYGRYLLRMEVLFKVDSTWTNIVSFESPSMHLITYDDHPPSDRGFSEGRAFSERNFTASDWTNLVAAKGDLAALGFKAWTNSPIKNFDAEWRRRKW